MMSTSIDQQQPLPCLMHLLVRQLAPPPPKLSDPCLSLQIPRTRQKVADSAPLYFRQKKSADTHVDGLGEGFMLDGRNW